MDYTLSACIIAKDEEKNIGRCINSLRNTVDEIIVIDTGSSDKTIEICENLGAKVIRSVWENNFAKARNLSLEYATMNWIIYVDADECLDEHDSLNLKAQLNPSYEGFCVDLINVVKGAQTLTCNSLRIFKNKKEYRFTGRIHEQIFPSINKFYTEDCIGMLRIKLYHYGYDSDLMDIRKKQSRNLTIFNSYPDSEKDGFYYYNYGNEHLRLGDIKSALKYYELSTITPGYDNGFRVFLPIYITKANYDLKRFKDALESSEQFLKVYDNFPDLYFLKASCHYEIGKYTDALINLNKYINYKSIIRGYPDFHFENCNDIKNLMADLNNRVIPHRNNLISFVIKAKEASPFIKSIVISLNEIADQIMILYDGEDYDFAVELEQLGCHLYIWDEDNPFTEIEKNVTGKWIVILDNNEFIDVNNARVLVDMLQKIEGWCYRVNIFKNNEFVSSNLRIIKNYMIKDMLKSNLEESLSSNNRYPTNLDISINIL